MATGAGETHMAALHLIGTGDVREAMAMYERAGALREAVMVGAAHLLPGDSSLCSLRCRWAAQLAAARQQQAAATQFLAGTDISRT